MKGFRVPKARKTLYNKDTLIDSVEREAKELLQGRGNLCRDDLEYVALAASRLKDDRLKSCIATLIGWGDDERARVETHIAIGIECMRRCSEYQFRQAAMTVELRYQMKIVSFPQEEE